VPDNTRTNWQGALLNEGAKIEQAIRQLNDSALQILLVVDLQGQLIGTITDGDIRRALLRGLTVTDRIDEVVVRDALVVPPDMRSDLVTQLMRANRIHQLPVVNEKRHVIGLHLWDEICGPSQRDNLMVIMAGGRGKRLAPHTETCPKPLLPVAGKPILEHIIERAKEDGFSRFLIAVHYLGNMIESYFGDGSDWDVRVNYLREDQPLGTAGALSLIDPPPDLPFVVTNGDVLADIRYGEFLDFHVRNRALATMAVRMYEWQLPFGVVHTKGIEVVGLEEKPIHRCHVNTGVYALEPQALDLLSVNEQCDMPSLFDSILAIDDRVVVYPMHEPWLDVGRPNDYDEAKRFLEHRLVSGPADY
jgi:dTDP-glucose pyrophosphorylase